MSFLYHVVPIESSKKVLLSSWDTLAMMMNTHIILYT